jgi:hypothetical protein
MSSYTKRQVKILTDLIDVEIESLQYQINDFGKDKNLDSKIKELKKIKSKIYKNEK